MDKQTKLRTILFLLITVVIGLLILFPLKALLYSDSRDYFYEYYSYIMLIPLISVYLLFSRRKEIWGSVKPSIPAGVLVGAIGVIGYGAGLSQGQTLEFIDQVAWQTASLLVAWFGAFLIFWGSTAFKEALFPLLFLFFIVPIPTDLMDTFIYALQWGSSEATALIFSTLGTPYYQDGFVFQLRTVTIEVAKQCSGIRSTMAMVITGVLAAHLFLRDNGKRLILMLTILPITVFKNGLRIVILTLLAIHVDERFLTGGFLHKSGGFLFYIPGLVIFGGILLFLRRFEKRNEG
jgi:exosortase